ncbi:TetR/AcrR family transcriptional regulator [Crossiella sp. CA198]|uniref:TetR/AcrR family transcriptional regulator n=1 Tax=Crossiella sp. CA198 TaxID=3455607 RepID=UPI003F8D889F
MPKGSTKRRPETITRLLDAALRVFAEQGLRGATIAQVCERAGYTRGAFYSNFDSLEELFFALFDRHADQQLDRLRESLEAGGFEALLAVDEAEVTWYLVSTEFTLHAIRDPAAARRLAEHDARLRATLTGILAGHLARLGRTATVDLDELARLVVALREGSLAQSLVEPDRLTPGHLEQTYLPILLTALSH